MAKKKRSASLQAESDDEESQDSSGEEEMSEEEQNEQDETPFLDTFYGLASAVPAERSQAAHDMLQHCLLGPNANTKDATYAFQRLLKGLCSGRAAARQGFASALTSFLKIAHATGALKDIQAEAAKDNAVKEESLFEFVRSQLLKTTDPKQAQGGKFGKVKGSEERDYYFGRLFGILSIVRSGILMPSGDDSNLLASKSVSLGLTNDLIELYHHKKWMREPTAHGIITLMNSLYNAKSESDAKIVVNHLVRDAIVPKLFADASLDKMTAEQIAVAVSIQSHDDFFDELPSPMDQAVVSSATIPAMVDALSATSSVVHPRMHLVWDVLWSYLTEASTERGSVRKLRESCPVGGENANKVVEALIQSLVTQSLLAIGSQGDGSNPTHERRALALAIVRAACGGQINSSAAGPYVISTDLELMENVILSRDIVKRLFLDTICAGGGSKGSHMLKPLALDVLGTIVESEVMNDVSSSESLGGRLAIVKALLGSDSRFDAKTKTNTVSDLLLLSDSVELAYTPAVGQMWKTYIEMLEDNILRASSGDGDVDMDGDENASGPRSHETLGYVDLLFNAAKRIVRLRVGGDNEAAFKELQSSIIRQILGFFMASAFFDCSNLTDAANKKKSKKKRKSRKQSFDAAEAHPVVTEGLRIKERLQDTSTLPYEVRVVISSRFFSLLADCTTVATSSKSTDGSSDDKQGKDAKVLQALSDVIDGWTLLEDCGAKSIAQAEDTDADTEAIGGAIKIVQQMQKDAKSLLEDSNGGTGDDELLAKTRSTVGSAILASALCLQFLRCGSSNDIVDEIDEDDGDDDEDIIEMISDLQSLPSRLVSSDNEESPEDESAPLLGLAELCIHVLSSHVGSTGQSRGAAPKLLREAVKFAWVAGLSAFATADANAALDDDVLSVILGAIGTSADKESESDGDEEASGSDDDESGSDESEEEKAVFSQAAGAALGLDDDDDEDESSDVEMKDANNKASIEDEDDVEIDSAQLQSMLLEDSEAILDDDDGIEVDQLEHHAGADAALAKLIKLKQDTRKAGRLALERLEISKRLRCMLLIDTLLSNPSRRWSNLLQAEVLAKIVVPLLQARRDLEKVLEKSSAKQLGNKSAGADNEKRALLEKLTTLLKTKVCKTRWAKNTLPSLKDVSELCRDLINQVRKSNSVEHSSCCSCSLLAVMRNVINDDNVDEMLGATKAPFNDAVMEWATKRTTKIQTSLFDDLVQQLPSLAQIVILDPLLKATKEARSSFLKVESFRLLGALYRDCGDEPSELDRKGLDCLEASLRSCRVIVCFSNTLQDEEMLKTKRAKEVLKAAAKVVAFQKTHPKALDSRNELTELKERLEKVKDASESGGVTSTCEKLASDIDEVLAQMDVDGEGGEREKKNKEVSSGKKKKKKKGKKKR